VTRFYLLVFGFSAPLWILAGGREVMPGLRASSMAVLCPVLAAAILVHGEEGFRGVARLLQRSVDLRRVPNLGWYVPVLLLAPGMAVLAYVSMRFMGLSVPAPEVPWAMVPGMTLVFFVAALGEELGWSAFAVERLQNRRTALGTGLEVGTVWALWHVAMLAQVGRAPGWIVWQAIYLVAFRVLLVWLYNNTNRSVCAVAICHAASNLAWQLFPSQGSHYDPRFMGPIAALAAVAVTAAWGPGTLSRASRVRPASRLGRRSP
jgi:membrane protease YdiL (CAAX protease family)